MRSLRRLFAALSALALLQLLLLGSGTPCAMGSDGAAHGGMSGAAMAAMNGHSAYAACDASGPRDDCGLPWSAGQCAGMTNCMPTVASPAAVAVLAIAPHRARELPEPARITSSAAAAPELPPPRA